MSQKNVTGRESGETVEDAVFSVWNFRDRRVVHLSFDRDRQRALEAAGLPVTLFGKVPFDPDRSD